MFATVLDKLSLGTPSTHCNLTLTPILAREPLLAIEPKSLEEGLADGTVKVTEVSAAGHVPELRVKNSGATPVLILDGEELVGAKQNRIVNVTVLVPPHCEIVIPVSCIEAGRWAYSRPGFTAAGRVLNQKIRSRKAESVSKNLKEHGRRFSDQGAVSDGVSAALCSLGVSSPTQSLSDSFDSRANAIDDFLEAFRLQPGQIGVICRIDGALAGLDLLGSEALFARAFPKLARGSALQALAGFGKDGTASLDDETFLNAALSSPGNRFPAVGLGEDLRIDTESIGGCALTLDDGLVHLFAFPRNVKPNEGIAA